MFQILGNKHLVLAMIRSPHTSAAQLRHFITQWRKHKESDKYKKTVADSAQKTQEQAVRKAQAHRLRQQLRDAERQSSDNVPELLQRVAEADTVYGFSRDTVGKGASAVLHSM